MVTDGTQSARLDSEVLDGRRWGAVCILSLDAGTSKQDGSEPRPAVIANCNIHREGPLDVYGLQDAICRWPKRQAFVKAALDQLLEGPKQWI